MENFEAILLLIVTGSFVIWAFIPNKPKSSGFSDIQMDALLEMRKLRANTMPIPVTESESLKAWKARQKSDILSRPSVHALTQEKGLTAIRYVDLINSREWHLKRLEVLIRDHYACQDCSKMNQKYLQVHHNYYLADRLPWDIDNTALVTLCRDHHKGRHNGKVMKVYKKVNGQLIETVNQNTYCDRCSGMGYLPQFSHVQEGICFKCHGDCITRSIFSNQLRWVSNSDLTSQVDALLSSIDQSYFDRYLANLEATTTIPPQ